MQNIRTMIREKPAIGWGVAGVLLLVAVYLAVSRTSGNEDAFGSASMTEMVTIKFTDTGKTEEWPRGRVVRELLSTGATKLDPNVGIRNPETGQMTGFIFSKAEWDQMINTLNTEREAAAKGPGQGGDNKKKIER
ncbi:MAG: hypothetical protein ACT4PL_01745 [Phycisphaerales bacterium]